MTIDLNALKRRAHFVRTDEGILLVQDANGGVRPATDLEAALAARVEELETKLRTRPTINEWNRLVTRLNKAEKRVAELEAALRLVVEQAREIARAALGGGGEEADQKEPATLWAEIVRIAAVSLTPWPGKP